MGCSSIFYITICVCDGDFYPQPPPDIGSTQSLPDPCCPDPCTEIKFLGAGNPVTTTSSITCRTPQGGAVGGTCWTTRIKNNYGCKPITPLPPDCTTSTTSAPPPPPPNSCNENGGGGN